MKRIVFIVLTFLTIACAQRHRAMPMPEAKEKIVYQPVTPQEWIMPNGLKVVYVQDKELPIVSGGLYIPRGTLWEKSHDAEVIAAMGYMMRQGGTKKLSPDELDFKLEKLAASVESDYSGELGSIGFSALKSDFEEVFSIFSDVVLEPRFAETRLDLWKGQMLEAIRRRSEDPNTVASISYKKLIFGDNAFGNTSQSHEINAINRSDLQKTYEEFVVPQGAYLAVIGDISKDQLTQAVTKYLGKWKAKPVDPARNPNFSYNLTPGIYFIEQPLEQATIYMGQQGPARLPPDYTAIEAFNNIFGSGDFGARLFSRIRTELGLAYSLYGAIVNSFLVGQNIVVLQTKSESAGQAVVETFNILNEMRSADVSEEELSRSQEATRNSFIFKIDTPEQALKRYVMLKLLNFPEDYDLTYLDKVNKLSTSEIKQVANKYWDLNKMVIVVVGNKKAYNAFNDVLQKNTNLLGGASMRVCKFKETLESCI